MAEGKKSFLLYADQISLVEMLPDEKAGQLFKLIMQYVNDKNPNTDDLLLKMAFEPFKLQLKRDLKTYESIVERNRENGKKGGRPKKTQENPKNPSGFSNNPDKPKKADNDTDTVNDNGSITPPTPSRGKPFTPPSLDEVKAYCEKRDRGVNPERWFDFYTSKGWMVGKNKMKDWKAAVRTWEEEKPKGMTPEEAFRLSGLNPDGTPKL